MPQPPTVSVTIPTQPPESFVAGETVKWTQLLSDYPADDSWTLTYVFDGPAQFTVTATQNGSGKDFSVTIAHAVTAAYSPGEYSWSARVEKAGERYFAASGILVVLANPASGTVSAAYTAWQTALAAYQAVVAGKVTNGTINGKTFTAHELGAFRSAVDRLKQDYLREKRAADRIAGRGGRRQILHRFTTPQ